MLNLYIFITTLLYPFILLTPYINKKAKAFLGKRKSDKKTIHELTIPETSVTPCLSGKKSPRVIWLHAASVGELDQCKAQAKAIKDNEPLTLIIQSVFSESVTEKQYDTENTFFTFRLPLDFYWAYNFIFEKFHPEVLVLMAWDTWTNLILAANRYNCKVYLASAMLDSKSKRNSLLARCLTKSTFRMLSGISCVNESMQKPFQKLTGTSVKILSCGDSRFDSVVDKIKTKKPNESFTKFAENYPYKKILILASTYTDCENVIFPNLLEILKQDYAVWIFPHKIDGSRIKDISANLQGLKLPFSVYSSLKNPCKDRIILFDVLGILAFAYFYGKIAYVGGAIHNKIHNVIEPAYFGLPIISGNKIFNSFDAMQLKESKSLLTMNTKEEFRVAFQNLSDEAIQKTASETNRKYVLSHLQASQRFYEQFLKNELPKY